MPRIVRLASRMDLPGTTTILAVILAFGLAWLAEKAGSAVIIGAFAAGLLLARTPQAHEIEHGVTELGNFFVPIFFVSVGAAVDVRVFNPLDPSNHSTLYRRRPAHRRGGRRGSSRRGMRPPGSRARRASSAWG